jgi:hypothetical protein
MIFCRRFSFGSAGTVGGEQARSCSRLASAAEIDSTASDASWTLSVHSVLTCFRGLAIQTSVRLIQRHRVVGFRLPAAMDDQERRGASHVVRQATWFWNWSPAWLAKPEVDKSRSVPSGHSDLLATPPAVRNNWRLENSRFRSDRGTP